MRKSVLLKAKPKGKRPRCLYCHHELLPQFSAIPPIPIKLRDGRRHAERRAWERENRPRFTGHYGRYADDRFCGQTCGYQYAIKKSAKKRSAKK